MKYLRTVLTGTVFYELPVSMIRRAAQTQPVAGAVPRGNCLWEMRKLERKMYKACEVAYQTEITPGVFVMTIDVGDMAKETKPGQFVMIKCWDGSEPFLMRPISVNSVDRKGGTMTLLYTVKGKGTQLLSELLTGNEVQILGPLGSAFPLMDYDGAANSDGSPNGGASETHYAKPAKRVALIGRGIGIAPLLLLAQDYHQMGVELFVYLSAKEEAHLFDKEAFEYLDATVRTTTNPNEVITDLMAEDCKALVQDAPKGSRPFDAAYSCGSNRLARGMQELGKEYGFPAYVSLEQHMACGIGACKGCVCTAKNPESGSTYFPRVCKEGPVFDVDAIY